MNKEQLRKLIAECVTEVMQEQDMEEGWFRDAWKTTKKAAGIYSPSSSGRDGWEKQNDAWKDRASYLNQKDKNPQKARQQRGNAHEEISNLIEDFDEVFRKYLQKAYVKAMQVDMNEQAVRDKFIAAIKQTLQSYKTLHKEDEEKEA